MKKYFLDKNLNSQVRRMVEYVMNPDRMSTMVTNIVKDPDVHGWAGIVRMPKGNAIRFAMTVDGRTHEKIEKYNRASETHHRH